MTAQLFNTVSDEDYISYTTSGVKQVVDFLHLHKNDVSKATGQKKESIRYDDRIPNELKERLEEIGNIINLTATFFSGDLKKTELWFKTSNPLLGDISPREMIRHGRYEKLRKFILNAISGNKP
jgi:hypothetical protein